MQKHGSNYSKTDVTLLKGVLYPLLDMHHRPPIFKSIQTLNLYPNFSSRL